jgi:hypothetical protein
MHFDIPQKNCSPKIEKYNFYVLRFAVSKVDRHPLLANMVIFPQLQCIGWLFYTCNIA